MCNCYSYVASIFVYVRVLPICRSRSHSISLPIHPILAWVCVFFVRIFTSFVPKIRNRMKEECIQGSQQSNKSTLCNMYESVCILVLVFLFVCAILLYSPKWNSSACFEFLFIFSSVCVVDDDFCTCLFRIFLVRLCWFSLLVSPFFLPVLLYIHVDCAQRALKHFYAVGTRERERVRELML